VGVRMPKTTFRPGENAQRGCPGQIADGKAAASDLGVLVFDRAWRRVRSDESSVENTDFPSSTIL